MTAACCCGAEHFQRLHSGANCKLNVYLINGQKRSLQIALLCKPRGFFAPQQHATVILDSFPKAYQLFGPFHQHWGVQNRPFPKIIEITTYRI